MQQKQNTLSDRILVSRQALNAGISAAAYQEQQYSGEQVDTDSNKQLQAEISAQTPWGASAACPEQ